MVFTENSTSSYRDMENNDKEEQLRNNTLTDDTTSPQATTSDQTLSTVTVTIKEIYGPLEFSLLENIQISVKR